MTPLARLVPLLAVTLLAAGARADTDLVLPGRKAAAAAAGALVGDGVAEASREAGGSRDTLDAAHLIAEVSSLTPQLARRFGIPPDKAQKFAGFLVQQIQGDGLLTSGATREEFKAFSLAFEQLARTYVLRSDLELYAENSKEKVELLQRIAASEQESDRTLEGAGRLREVFRAAIQTAKAAREQSDKAQAAAASGALSSDYLEGSVALMRGRHAAAASDFGRAAQADPASALAYSGRASANYLLGRFQESASDARQALSLDPGDRSALTVLRFSEAREGAAGAAGAAAAVAASGRDQDSRGAGAAPPQQGFATAAQARFAAEADRMGPADGAARGAATALRLGDLASARAQADRALALDPGNPSTLNLRASIRARAGDLAGAAEDARAGLAGAPASVPLLRTLGYALLRSRDPHGALAAADGILVLNTRDAFAHALRGHALGSLGDLAAMRAEVGQAAALDPRFAAASARAGAVVAPADSDILFLFPGEMSAVASAPAATVPGGRGRAFGLVGGASVAGGALLSLGLLGAALAPLKRRLTPLFTRREPLAPAAIALTAPERSAGLIQGRYEITRPIGAGGMGLVFEGVDRALGRRVAIKKMRDEIRSDPRERARFVAEARTVASLRHPNIVDIYAIVEEGADVYLVFEYLDGRTIDDLVRASGPLAPEEAARIARAAADALGYAHGRGVVHRDMKPSNMMIDARGGVKVMDFGIASLVKDALTRRQMTNTVAGTPPYMAPEQEQGHVRRESDVYALAVCAYEMLTGRRPFSGSGAGALLNKINMSFVPPSHETPGLPQALDAVFEHALQADPDRRCGTPGELADALDAALGSAAGV